MSQDDAIDWSRITTANGTAAHVPRAAQGLADPDPAVREAFYWQLDNYVVLQSDLYEAAYFTIPLLLRLLRADPPPPKDYAYDLLYEIGAGHAATDCTVRTASGEVLPLTAACHAAVDAGRDLYARDAEADPDPRVRKTAADLLEWVDERLAAEGAEPH